MSDTIADTTSGAQRKGKVQKKPSKGNKAATTDKDYDFGSILRVLEVPPVWMKDDWPITHAEYQWKSDEDRRGRQDLFQKIAPPPGILVMHTFDMKGNVAQAHKDSFRQLKLQGGIGAVAAYVGFRSTKELTSCMETVGLLRE